MMARADRGGQLGLDQLLQGVPQQAAEQIMRVLVEQIGNSGVANGII